MFKEKIKHLDPLALKFHIFFLFYLFSTIQKTMETPSKALQNLFDVQRQ
jgi:hypothetical protein